ATPEASSGAAERGRGGGRRPRHALQKGGRDDQAVRHRDGGREQPGGHAHPRRLRLLERVPGRTLLPRCAAVGDRRRHQRDAAHHHCQATGGKESHMSLPLTGLRVVSVEQYGAGPFGTQHLADLGAEVIKIENPHDGGDVGRAVGPHYFGPGNSHFYQAFNRNKKSVTLDLKKPEGQQVLRDLCRHADAVFNNLRGDLPGRLGLTYEAMREVRPDIVCVHLSAYGRDGERAGWPGYDYLMQAEAGYLSLTGEPEGPPSRFGLSIIDLMTGTTAALGLVSAV